MAVELVGGAVDVFADVCVSVSTSYGGMAQSVCKLWDHEQQFIDMSLPPD